MEDNNVKRCKVCGDALVEGTLKYSRACIFVPDCEEVPRWQSKKAMATSNSILLADPWKGPFPVAYYCETCKTVTVPVDVQNA